MKEKKMALAEIILIDDDDINNIITKISLTRHLEINKIIAFTNPLEGLEYIKSKSVKENYLLFLDINMPGMNGWDFLNHFEALHPEQKNCFKIYLLSTSLDNGDIEKSKSNKHVAGYLIKPLSKNVIESLFEGNNS